MVSAARALQARPGDTVALQELTSSVASIDKTLVAQEHSLDLQAELSYVVLLIGASLGWMVWFRKLVARHRKLQSEITEQHLRHVGERRLAALVRNASDVVALLDPDSTVSFVTPSSRSTLGIDAADLVGTRWTDLIHADEVDHFVHVLAGTGAGEDQAIQTRIRHADGRTLHVEGGLSNLLADPAVGGFVLTVRDVTARVDLERRLTHQAFHDALTGLANRQLFSDRLGHALVRRPRADSTMVVLFCDLDDFKNVNDSLGHGVGDEVLSQIGERLRTVVRDGDTAARLGGDEFAVLMEATTMTEAEEVAARIAEVISVPIELQGHTLRVEASIGLALAVPGELSAEEALRNADVAMYLAKDRGKGGIAVYESRLHAEALERLQIITDLQRALRTDSELVLHFQPTIDLETTRIVGFEALVRWQHPTRGLLAPGLFIPIAEQSGLIVPLGSWVLRTACEAAATLDTDQHPMKISINVAAQQLAQPGFVHEVTEVLADTGLPPERLVIEITEGVVLQGLDEVVPKLSALREMGVRIAIDDFGTGYSSLSYLRNLPVDVLKVDKAFIDKVTLDTQDAALTEAIIAMSASMHLTTIAEGVEDSAQADWLVGARCEFGQGYLWSRPVPLDQARALLAVQDPEAGTVPGATRRAQVLTPS